MRRAVEAAGRTAGTAGKKVTRGNLLQILTAGDVVEDADEDVGDAEAIESRPVGGAGRWRPARHFVGGSYSTWRKNPPADFLQMQEAES
jgi:hypothetical protein